jgi:hypothetical protein
MLGEVVVLFVGLRDTLYLFAGKGEKTGQEEIGLEREAV